MTNEEWFSYGEIKFTRRQLLWILGNAAILREGCWPSDPVPSGYKDIPIMKKRGKQAGFIRPIEIITEVLSRAEKCGEDGLILIAIECWGETSQSMARYLRRPEWSIDKRRKRALAYVASGPARRWHNTRKRQGKSYAEFKERKK